MYYGFDLLYLDGFDLRAAPLTARKAALAPLLAAAGSQRVRYSEHIEGDGDAVLQARQPPGTGGHRLQGGGGSPTARAG